MRYPYAMRTMMAEILDACEDAMFETQEPDGYDVWRTLLLDPETTAAFSALLDVLDDQRILHKGISFPETQRYHIKFVSDPRADDPKPFGLDAAYHILRG